jgi:hypothetical protein
VNDVSDLSALSGRDVIRRMRPVRKIIRTSQSFAGRCRQRCLDRTDTRPALGYDSNC